MVKRLDKFGMLAPPTMENLPCKQMVIMENKVYISLLHSQYCNNTLSDGAAHCLCSQDSRSSSVPAITAQDMPISVKLFCQFKLMIVHQLFVYYYY